MDSVKDDVQISVFVGSGGGVPFSETGNVGGGADLGSLTLPAFTVMLMSVSLSFLQLICTLPEASWAGTCPSSLSLLLTQQHMGPREASVCVCGMDK